MLVLEEQNLERKVVFRDPEKMGLDPGWHKDFYLLNIARSRILGGFGAAMGVGGGEITLCDPCFCGNTHLYPGQGACFECVRG